MSLTVRVTSRIPAYSAEARTKMAVACRKAAFEIEMRAKAKAPVDTGALRSGINANGGGLSWRVDAPAEYAIYQEFGTYKMAAHPFMIPALEEVRPVFLAALRSIA